MKNIFNLFLITISLQLYGANIFQQSPITDLINIKYCNCSLPTFICTDNTLCQIYPNQNMCALLQEIPKELQNLSFAIYPNTLEYNTARFIYNKRFNIFTHAIFQPKTESEIIYVLKYLIQYNLEFSIRSGGHCYEPGSLSAGYVIDLQNFNTVRLNIENQEVYVGAGARLGDVILKLGNYGYAIPTGTCGTNGVTGLTLGGGVGFLARKFGLTCDVVKNIKILTADLKIITVDLNNYSDLFWALRGAGNGSYGIVLGFTFNIFFVPKVGYLELKWDWETADIISIFNAWQTWIGMTSNDITGEIDLDYNNGKRTISIFALKVGDQPFNEWESAFKNLNPQKTINTSIPYTEAAELLGGDSILPFGKSKSKMLFEPLSNQAINIIINFFNELHDKNKQFFVHFEFDSAGGQSATGDTAYFPRNAFAWFFQDIRWASETQNTEAIDTINKFYSDIEPFTSPFSYANFVDYDLLNTYLNAYYGTHVDRLIQIKNIYDPKNIFKWQQSIPLNKKIKFM